MTQQVGTRIKEIGRIVVIVSDQDKAIDFYCDKLGMDKKADEPFGNGFRWVELGLPGAKTGIALMPPTEGQTSKPGSQTGIIFSTNNIDDLHHHLKNNGVDTDEQVARMGDPIPPMFWFRDPDGNTLAVVEERS